MKSKNIFFNNNEFSENNKNIKEEKQILRYKFKYKNKNNYNLNCIPEKSFQNKNIKQKEVHNKINNKEEEDDFNFKIYKNSVAKNDFLLSYKDENIINKTITFFDSFQKKYKEIFNFDKYKSYKNRNNIISIELSSELNLSFVSNINKNLNLDKQINKNKPFLLSIIRIFDKSHKQIEKMNQKNFVNKYNNHYIFKNRINNYNYLKYKNISKFSKKENKKNLTRNFTTKKENLLKISSEIIKENNITKNIINEDKENYNTTIDPIKKFKIANELSKTKDKARSTTFIFNKIDIEQKNKMNGIKLSHKDNNDFSIGLRKNSIFDSSKEKSNFIENNSNRNSINFTRKYYWKYKAINNINRRTKSTIEEDEKNNNKQSIRDSMKHHDNIKQIKLENNRITNKRIKRNEINSKKINTNGNEIKTEINQNGFKKNILYKTMTPLNQLNDQISLNDNKNGNNPIVINKRKKNIYLSKNTNEFSEINLDKNKNEENKIQLNFGRSFIQTHQSTSQSLLSEPQSNNIELKKSVNNFINSEKSIKSTKNHAINLNSKNFVNNRSHIYQSDKGNKSKMIYKNYNCIGINSAKNDGNQNILIQKENTKNENLNTGRLLRRYKIIKGKEEDKRNNNVLKNQDISKLNNKNNKDSNPFRDNDNNNYYCSKKLNNHKFHEIKSTSSEKNTGKIEEHKYKNYISPNNDNKLNNHLIASTSMRNLNIAKKINIIYKNHDNKKQIENS